MPQPSEIENITIPTRKADRKRLLRRYPGILSAISRRHRVRVSHVSRVFHGQITSARVLRAIKAELLRRQGKENDREGSSETQEEQAAQCQR